MFPRIRLGVSRGFCGKRWLIQDRFCGGFPQVFSTFVSKMAVVTCDLHVRHYDYSKECRQGKVEDSLSRLSVPQLRTKSRRVTPKLLSKRQWIMDFTVKKTLLVCCHRPVSRAHPCLMFPALESSNVIMCFHLLRPICAKWKNHHLSEGVLMLQKHVAKHVRQRCKLTKPNGWILALNVAGVCSFFTVSWLQGVFVVHPSVVPLRAPC